MRTLVPLNALHTDVWVWMLSLKQQKQVFSSIPTIYQSDELGEGRLLKIGLRCGRLSVEGRLLERERLFEEIRYVTLSAWIRGSL